MSIDGWTAVVSWLDHAAEKQLGILGAITSKFTLMLPAQE